MSDGPLTKMEYATIAILAGRATLGGDPKEQVSRAMEYAEELQLQMCWEEDQFAFPIQSGVIL
jgi:hypothetical protein